MKKTTSFPWLWSLGIRFLYLGNVSLQRLELRTKRWGKKWGFTWEISLSFLWTFSNVLVLLQQTWVWDFRGLGFSFGLWAWLMAGSHFFYILATVDHWAWWASGLWQIYGVLDLVCCGLKKRTSTNSKLAKWKKVGIIVIIWLKIYWNWCESSKTGHPCSSLLIMVAYISSTSCSNRLMRC